MMPEQPVIVNEVTRVILGRLAHLYGGTYGDVIEMLAVEQLLREALDDEAAGILISTELLAKIRKRLTHVPDSVDPPGR